MAKHVHGPRVGAAVGDYDGKVALGFVGNCRLRTSYKKRHVAGWAAFLCGFLRDLIGNSDNTARPGWLRLSKFIQAEVMTKGTRIWYVHGMKAYAWDTDKNDQLIRERGISFEDIVVNIRLGNEVDIYRHPNQVRYPGQNISVVIVDDYAFLVPHVENDDEVFLKTIIPSRKVTKRYLGDK